MTRTFWAIAGVSAALLGMAPANAQLMNENSQVIALPGNPQLGEPGLGMSDVVKESGPPERCLAISGAKTARHGIAESTAKTELGWPNPESA